MNTLVEHTVCELKSVEVSVYRGLHLRQLSETDRATVDEWLLKATMTLEDYEALLNNIHVWDYFQYINDEEKVKEIAETIYDTWLSRLSALNGRYRVMQRYDYGPQITFFLDRES